MPNALGTAASLVEEHPMKSHQPFYDSTSGAARPLVACYQRDARKVIYYFELPKSIFLLDDFYINIRFELSHIDKVSDSEEHVAEEIVELAD